MQSRKQRHAAMDIADYSPSVIAGRALIAAAKKTVKTAKKTVKTVVDHSPAGAVYHAVRRAIGQEKRDSSGKWTASMSQGSRKQRYSMGLIDSLLQVTGGRHRDKHGRSLTGGYRVRDTPENRAITEKHGAHKIGGIGERARDEDGKFAGFGGKGSRGPLFLSQGGGSRKQRYLASLSGAE